MSVKQIVRISPHQTSKVFALLYFLIGLIVGSIVILTLILKGEIAGLSNIFISLGGIFLFSFIYMIVGYISGLIFCVLYNFVAKNFGGIELSLSNTGCDQEGGACCRK